MKKYFPVNLDINNKRCVVVGSGSVGRRKADTLKKFGADLVVIDKEYRPEILAGAYLVVAATNDREVNRQIAMEARAKGILVNVVDSADESDYISPAMLESDGLMITVSSHGESPARSKRVRDELRSYRFKS